MTRSIFAPATYFTFRRRPRAIAELDGLRALAILLVLARHAVWPLYRDSQPLFPVGSWDLAIPLLNGWIGVDLFFVLSGFLITHHLLRRDNTSPLARIGAYVGARALRIVPAYLAVLALVVGGSIPLYDFAHDHLDLRIAYHLLFLQDYLPANIVVPLWSLGVEEKFYLVAPFLVWAALRGGSPGRRAVLLAMLILLPTLLRALTALQHPDVSEYYWFFRTFRSPFHVSFDGLAIGVACAFLYCDRDPSAVRQRRTWATRLFWVSTLALLVQLFVVELLGELGWYQKILQPLVLSLTFGGLLLSVVFGGAKSGLLRARSLMVIARISYPLYLIHITFVPLALALSGFADGPFDFLRFLAIYLGLSFTAALVLHFAVEKPFLLVKDQLGQTAPRVEPRPAGRA